jgi:hypothetical protein
LFRLNPLGSAGVPALITQLCTVAPEPALIVVGVMLIAIPTVPEVPLAPAKESAGLEVPVPVKSKFRLPGLESASV